MLVFTNKIYFLILKFKMKLVLITYITNILAKIIIYQIFK